MTTIELDGANLTLEQYARVACGGKSCRLSDSARRRIAAGRQAILDLPQDRVVYGVNTGFGDLASVRIEADQILTLQERLLHSHAAGMGRPLSDATGRGMLLLRANTLARGRSGVRVELVERVRELLDREILPRVPSRGSVGASGDLAPLAHLALPLIGQGTVRWRGREMPAGEALADAGLEPLRLEAKEGLGLINGTQAMTALVALAVLEIRRLTRIADLVGALTTDALRGSDDAFDARLHALRPHVGQRDSAANLWRLLEGSGIRESHRQGDERVQDPYSVRCMPQVHGAVRDLVSDAERRLAVEMNSVTDNPLVFAEDGDVLSGGNFHGEPIALAADCLALGTAELGSISERRIEKLTMAAFSGLAPFLAADPGLDSGFMIAQVTAASAVGELRVLAHPASVDSIPTSAGKEDHVSMGMGAALKLGQALVALRRILAIELVTAAQAIDLLRPLRSSQPLEELHGALRERVAPWREDHPMADDLEAGDRFLAAAVDPHLSALL
jgi:histidine ammonia-lyase